MRNLGLDLLRFVAVFLVLGRHLHLPPDASPILDSWKRGGWVGVDLFFVLSGFLVSSLLFKEQIRTGSVDMWRFLIRRGFKIYPAFWCMLRFTLTVQNMQGTPPNTQTLLGELLFLQNYLGGIWPHTWSLAVEEHFYLGIAALFTTVLACQRHKNFDWIPFAFAITAILFSHAIEYPSLQLRNFLFPSRAEKVTNSRPIAADPATPDLLSGTNTARV
jgi:peptidoglycan/LPS O-acetylase OafA/YrhL